MVRKLFCLYCNFKSSPHNAPNMRQWIASALVPINGLSTIQRQTIIYDNAGLLSIRSSGRKFSEKSIKIQNFSLTKMHVKISFANQWSFCPGRYELMSFQGNKSRNSQCLWLIPQRVYELNYVTILHITTAEVSWHVKISDIIRF